MPPPNKTSITFVEDHVVDDLRKGTAFEERYKSKQKVSLEHASAMHFLSRGLAVLTPAKKAKAPTKPEAPVEPADLKAKAPTKPEAPVEPADLNDGTA